MKAWYYSAAAYQRTRQPQKAIECYQKVISDWPDSKLVPSVQFMIGQCLERMIEEKLIAPSEAKASIKAIYQQILDNYPNSPDAEYSRLWIKDYDSKN